MAGYGMNPARAKHMGQEHNQGHESPVKAKHEALGEHEAEHSSPAQHIHIHSHDGGHTVHLMHEDGTHTKHEHEKGDAEGIKAHIDQHIGGQFGGEEGPEAEHQEPDADDEYGL